MAFHSTSFASLRPQVFSLEGRRRLQLFAITAGAAFLIAISVLGRPIKTKPVRVVVAPSGALPSDPSLDFAFAEQRIKQQDHLLAAAQAADLNRHLADESEILRHLRQHLSATTSFGVDGAPLLQLGYTGNLAEGAQIVNDLAKRYVNFHYAERVDAAREQHEQATRALEDAESQVKQAQAALEQFLSQHFAANQQTADAHEPSRRGEARVNPRWIELTEQVDQLRAQRSEALVQMTPAHPVVQELDSRIAQAAARLSATPRYLADERQRFTPHSRPTPLAPGEMPPQLDSQRYEQLQARHREALELHKQAVARVGMAHQARESVGKHRLQVVSWAEPQSNRKTGAAAWSFAFLLALVFGGGVAMKGVPADPTFRSVKEAEETLPVPVVAVLPASDPAGLAPQCNLPGWSVGVKRACEAVLVLFVCCVVVLLVADGDYFRRFFSAPLEIFSGSVWRAAELWRA